MPQMMSKTKAATPHQTASLLIASARPMHDTCQLISTFDGARWRHQCDACKLSVRNKRATIPCVQSEIAFQPPSLPRRLANFTQAVTAHLVAGMPQASPAEIERRWAICQACELFDGSICTHKSCGCNVSNEQKFLNKLAWAEQKCPAGKW